MKEPGRNMKEPGESKEMKQVRLITDGACVGNPGRGGWAYILRYGGHTREMSDRSTKPPTIAWN